MGVHTKTAVAAVAVTLAVPGAAQAAQRSVDMGLPVKSQKTFIGTYLSDVNAFFPRTVTIHARDTVRFVPVGFHNVDIPPKGKNPFPLIRATGKKVSGATDAAGNPFWFNGQDEVGFNPALLKFAFGKRLSYTGARRVQSGLPIMNRPRPMIVKFTRRGSFTYYCDVHPGMKGTVRVVSARRSIPSAKAHARAVRRQLAAALKTAKSLVPNARPPANTVLVGLQGANGVHHFGFAPSNLSVPSGTTVRFQMPAQQGEDHTATFGPGDPEKEPNSFLGKMAASFQNPAFDATAVYPSDPPPAPATFTPSSHGNGFWNSGILDSLPASPVPSSNSVTFGAAGTYRVYCLIHPFMKGTITVT